jgi:hypothetical protein
MRVALLAVMGLLIAQFGAMSHAYSHDAGAAAAASHRSGSPSHDPCGDCLGFAALLSPGAAPCALPFTLPQGRSATACVLPGSLVERFRTVAFRSRAPPYTL